MIDKDKLGFDPYTCPIDELEKKIEEFGDQEEYWNTMQLSAKTFINSVYGVFGTKFFNLANTDIAESITLQGQHLIKYSVVQINKYFKEQWHKDVEGHKKIAAYMKERFAEFDDESFLRIASTNQLSFDTLQCYGDTDSAYITMEPLIRMYGIPKEQQTEFSLAVHRCVLDKFLDDKFEEYAKAFNCDKNLEKFELEKISRTIIMLSKKNYICDVAWADPNMYYEPLSHITYTGYDVVKGTVTNYCRKEMKYFTEFVLSKLNDGKKPTMGEIVQVLREIKKRFAMQSPNDISKTVNCSNYENFVKDDKGPVVQYFENTTADGKKAPLPIHVRAAATYNNILYNKGKKYLSKYDTIKSNDKVRFYYINDDDVFGFIPDDFPAEFAPPIDVDVQFDKMLLSPLNRIISAIGYNEVPPSLTYNVSLF